MLRNVFKRYDKGNSANIDVNSMGVSVPQSSIRNSQNPSHGPSPLIKGSGASVGLKQPKATTINPSNHSVSMPNLVEFFIYLSFICRLTPCRQLANREHFSSSNRRI